MNFGMTEILIVTFIIILLFGAKRLPELAKGLGASIKNFRKGINEEEDDDKDKNIEGWYYLYFLAYVTF